MKYKNHINPTNNIKLISISLRLAHYKESQCGNPTTEWGWRTDVPAKQVVGQQLHSRQGQVFSCAAAQPQGNVSGSFPGSGPGNTSGCPGAHLQESKKCGSAEGVCKCHTSLPFEVLKLVSFTFPTCVCSIFSFKLFHRLQVDGSHLVCLTSKCSLHNQTQSCTWLTLSGLH